MRRRLFPISIVALLLLGLLLNFTLASAADPGVGPLFRRRTAMPTKTLTQTRTPTSLPGVTGSVLIHNGGCCMGGPVGSTIYVDVAFSASSTAGAVTDMRVNRQGVCTVSQDLSSIPWEPFVTSKIYPYTIMALNWVGYYVGVQYRDSAGNISPVYCDDLSIEGMPSLTVTTTPVTPTATNTPSLSDFSGSPLSGAVPLTVQFTALYGPVYNCTWTFGDGTSQTFANNGANGYPVCPTVSHTYSVAGSYTVSLRVTPVGSALNFTTTKTNYIQVGGSVTSTPTFTRTPTKTPTLPRGT